MARPTLFTHRKFRRLVHLLQEPKPHVLGYLEMIWASAYESGEELIGDANDVELAAEFPHTPGKLVRALMDSGFVDEREGLYYVHDLLDHAPEYVSRRLKREQERRARGDDRKHRFAHRDRQKTASWRSTADDDGIRPPNSALGGHCPTNAELRPSPSTQHPAPAPSTRSQHPAPAPAPDERAGAERASLIDQQSSQDVPQHGTGPIEMRFPAADDQEWRLHRNQLLRFRELHPSVDVVAELRLACDWLERKAKKPRPASRMLQFLSDWLGRAPASPQPVQQSLSKSEQEKLRHQQQIREREALAGPADALPLAEVARRLKASMSSNGVHTPAAEGGGR